MRKAAYALLAISFLALTALTFSLHMSTAEAHSDFSISHVHHTIGIMRNGYVIVNDTLEINFGGSPPSSFRIGFPYEYGEYVLKCIAYSQATAFPIEYAVSLEERVGFYVVEVKLGDEHPEKITVLFILSNKLVKQSETNYMLNAPAYPSLTKEAENCSVKINLPIGAENVNVEKDGEAVATEFWTEDLPAFTYSAVNVTFSLSNDEIQLFDAAELKREVRFSGTREIQLSDSYYITNKAPQKLSYTVISLPPDASNPTALDQFGRKMSSEWINKTTGLHKLSFNPPLKSGESAAFDVVYFLPSQYLLIQGTTYSFNAALTLFQNMDYYVEKALLIFKLPEGAKTAVFENTLTNSGDIAKDVFQEVLTVKVDGASYLETLTSPKGILKLSYEYNLLWLAFRPTLWMCALALVCGSVALVWKRPKPARVKIPLIGAKVQVEDVKSFLRMYEEKNKILFDLESLEARVRKGKIPRRRYKVQRRTLEIKLSALEKNLAELKETMRKAGGLYADLIRQLELSEAQIDEVKANVKSIETRHNQGTLSLEAYKKLLAEYQQREDKAQTTINGILLRLREEIR